MSCIRGLIYYFCYIFNIQYKTYFILEQEEGWGNKKGRFADNYITTIPGTIKFLKYNQKIEQEIGLIILGDWKDKIVKVFITNLEYTGNPKITNPDYKIEL